jgi:hypothetical protein
MRERKRVATGASGEEAAGGRAESRGQFLRSSHDVLGGLALSVTHLASFTRFTSDA